MLENLTNIGIYAAIGLFGLLTIGIIFARLYKRASKEVSYVRTGMGGQKVFMDKGGLVFPVLHETIPVNMNTLRLAVQRANEQALITRDRMRVDVIAEFYVRVQPTQEAIGNAAQTLGARTMYPEQLKDLIEGKFVDALRSVAAEMSMEELHEKRVEFVQKVQQAVSEDLLKNGLELESVSLTGLDQTGMEFFNPNNAFDAEGLTRLTEEIEQRKKIRNDIEQDTAVQIRNKNLQAEKETLEIAKEEEYAKLAQEREVEIRRAAQMAEIAKEQADKERDAQQAKIVAERSVEEERIEKERVVKEKDIAKARAVETQDIERRKAVELAEQERDIAISQKSREQSEAAAEADAARAIAVKAEEQVSTARDTEVADRMKQIELIEAAKEAEREALAITIAAEAEKNAAKDTAEAKREKARGDADQARITAEGEAEAEKMRAQAAEVSYAVEAAGTQALNEAANLLSNDQIDMKVKLELIDNLESIIRESAKPMENIDDIKIIQLDGLNGATAAGAANIGGGESAPSGGGNLADQVVSSALKYRAQAPLVDSLMKEVGLNAGDLNGLTDGFKEAPASSDTPKRIDAAE
ncbi:flotillin family protein [Kordiimonas laminariae]|uniref:flotillin family protein n=1 Tax=Kordiimonas laminariae TaxID=2917717 RepID=UPI001FF5C617|nr:flotillin domain-containing protein [Kordiimonas laminariae]MCK0068077.1 flotillin family protein [Kordiimonas laminariae]